MDAADLPDWQAVLEERTALGDLRWAAALGPSAEFDRVLPTEVASWLADGTAEAPQPLRPTLIDLDLIDDRGTRTPAAAWAARVLAPDAPTGARATRRDADGLRALRIGYDHELAVAIEAAPDGTTAIAYRSLESLPQFLSLWLGIEPAWVFDAMERRIGEAELHAAVTRRDAEDPEGPGQVAAMLALPWRHWTLSFGPGGEIVEFVQVPGWGVYAPDRHADGVELVPVVPGELVLGIIRGVIAPLTPEG